MCFLFWDSQLTLLVTWHLCLTREGCWGGVQGGGKVRVAVIREEGSNGDREMAAAVWSGGMEPWDVTMSDLLNGRAALDSFQGQTPCLPNMHRYNQKQTNHMGAVPRSRWVCQSCIGAQDDGSFGHLVPSMHCFAGCRHTSCCGVPAMP